MTDSKELLAKLYLTFFHSPFEERITILRNEKSIKNLSLTMSISSLLQANSHHREKKIYKPLRKKDFRVNN